MSYLLSEKKFVFLNCYKALFGGLFLAGVKFFKIEIVVGKGVVKNYNEVIENFDFIFSRVELSEFAVFFAFSDKVCIIFAGRSLFINSVEPLKLSLEICCVESSSYVPNYCFEFFETTESIFSYFELLVSSTDVKFFTSRKYNSFYNDLYYRTQYYLFSTSPLFMPFLKKQYISSYKFGVPSDIKEFYGLPSSRRLDYDEYTIITIWSLFIKNKDLKILDGKLLSKEGNVLGSYVEYLVDNFFAICKELRPYYYANMINMDFQLLCSKYMDKASLLIRSNYKVLLFFDLFNEKIDKD